MVFNDSDGVANPSHDEVIQHSQFERRKAGHVHLLLDIFLLRNVARHSVMLLGDLREPAVVHVRVHLQEKQLAMNHTAALQQTLDGLLHLFSRTLQVTQSLRRYRIDLLHFLDEILHFKNILHLDLLKEVVHH